MRVALIRDVTVKFNRPQPLRLVSESSLSKAHALFNEGPIALKLSYDVCPERGVNSHFCPVFYQEADERVLQDFRSATADRNRICGSSGLR